MFVDIHTHREVRSDGDILSICALDVPAYICCCGLELSGINRSLGIHPWTIREELLSEDLRFIENIAQLEPIKAIGECGLDKVCDTPFRLQQRAFEAQVAISERLKKPLIIHCVKAFDELLEIRRRSNPTQAWIIHGFRGKPEQMLQLTAHGLYLSFGEKFNPESLRQMAGGQLFFETDQSPRSIREIYTVAASVRTSPVGELAGQIRENYRAAFRLDVAE